jgi:BirA family biotin operon repressor/biotin-[acetyl-CoA-carboxylase] ligase
MSLSADAIRRYLGVAVAQLEALEVFAEIESTNSYLMQQPAPLAGLVRVAVTDNQIAGRGRHGRSWQSPPGSGLCLSLAYTFAAKPENLAALTLAAGLSVVNALKEQRVDGVQLKWPNDLVASDSKLGGILTETHLQSCSGGPVTVVIGVGLNLDLSGNARPPMAAGWARRATDIRSNADSVPDKNALASSLVRGLGRLLHDYESAGFDQFRGQWLQHDWLRGRAIAIETPRRRILGVGMGIADDGALLIETPTAGLQRVTSGTVTMAEVAELSQ